MCIGNGRTTTGFILSRDVSIVIEGGLNIIGRSILGNSKVCGEGRELVELLVSKSIRD